MLDLNNIWRWISQFLGPTCLVVAIIWGISQHNRANKAEKSINTVKEYITSETEFKEVIEDSSKTIEFTSKELHREEILSKRVDSIDSVIDSIIEPYRERIKQLTVTNAALTSKSKGIIKQDKVEYEDPIIQWKFDKSNDSLDLNINLRHYYLSYYKSKSLLGFNYGKGELHNKIWFEDSKKRITFNKVNHIYIKTELPRRDMNVYSVAEYRFNNNNIMLGPEIEFKINNMVFNGRYLYDISNSMKEPSVGFKYNFLQ